MLQLVYPKPVPKSDDRSLTHFDLARLGIISRLHKLLRNKMMHAFIPRWIQQNLPPYGITVEQVIMREDSRTGELSAVEIHMSCNAWHAVTTVHC